MRDLLGELFAVIAVAVGFLAAIFVIIFLLTGIHYNTTRAGQHNGYVTAIEQGGIIYHNYGVYFKTDNSGSQEDQYCVRESDETLIAQLIEFNKSKTPVTIHYDGERGFGFNLCTHDRIISVEADK